MDSTNYGWAKKCPGRVAGWSGKILSCLAVVAGLCVQGQVLFQDNWDHETVGDNANQLTWWRYEASYGSAPAADAIIVPVSGTDKALNMNPGGNLSMGIRSQYAYSVGTWLSMRTDMLLTTDGNGAGVIGFARSNAPLYGYVLAVSRDPGGGTWLDLRKFNGDLNDSFTVGPVLVSTINPLVRQTYRLDAVFTSGAITFSVYVNNVHQTHPNLNVTDSAPHNFANGAWFVLAANFGQQAYFDNFFAIPEPATCTLLMAGVTLLRLCRCRTLVRNSPRP